jgi:hypothetical protein
MRTALLLCTLIICEAFGTKPSTEATMLLVLGMFLLFILMDFLEIASKAK